MAVFVAFGSNIEPESNLPRAIARLDARAPVRALSTVYLSRAEGAPGAPPFANGVLEVATRLGPRELKFDVLRAVEAEMGRERTADKNAPRPIDLDLILYDERIIKAPDLVLPDPQILVRPYIAVPLCELAPGLTLPGTTSTVRDIVGSLPRHGLKPLAGLTRRLKETYHGR